MGHFSFVARSEGKNSNLTTQPMKQYPTPPVTTVKPGTIITFVYGPGEFPEPEFCQNIGRAYGVKRGRFGDSLRVKMADCSFQYVSSFRSVGIGAYCHI